MRYTIILLLVSCSAEKKLNKLYVNKPELVAEKTRQWFPCVPLKADTITKTIDSTVYIECPKNDYDYFSKDTIIKTVKVPVSLPIRYVYISQKIEDSAKVFVRDKIIEDKSKKLEKTKEQIVRKSNFNWILIAICITLFFLNILQFKKKW